MSKTSSKPSGEPAAALGAVAVFACLAAAVASGGAGPFDSAVRGYVHALSFPALTYAMRGFTAIGEALFLVPFGALVAWRLAVAGRRRQAAFFAAATLGGELFDQVLKLYFRRPRPDAFFGESPASYSFPSGHALESLCFFVVLAEVVLDDESPRHRRFAGRSVALFVAGMIGLSRIYLGVHYPTDVLAGYAAAIAWLAALRYFYHARPTS